MRLARFGQEGAIAAPITVAEVAGAYQISRDHLMKVSQRLTQLEMIHATRGRGGGLQLAQDPASLRLGAVVRALELSLIHISEPTRPY